MTREQAKELLPVIRAFVEGKTVQIKASYDPNAQWQDCLDNDLYFGDVHVSWRIKPEPREFWLVGHKHAQTMPWVVYTEQPRASDPSTQHAYEIIHVREVLE